MAADNEFDGGVVAQSIEYAIYFCAGDAEDDFDASVGQRVDYNVGKVAVRHFTTLGTEIGTSIESIDRRENVVLNYYGCINVGLVLT